MARKLGIDDVIAEVLPEDKSNQIKRHARRATPLEPLAKTHKVIAVELQGHGRTADTDRSLSFETMGDDIAALLN